MASGFQERTERTLDVPNNPPAPKGVGLEARRLWRDVLKDFQLGPAELRILEDACREMDLIGRMEDDLEGADLVVRGSQRQPAPNPLVQEVRLHRAVLRQLLGALRLPDDDLESWDGLTASERARRAASARWRKGRQPANQDPKR